MTSLRPATEPPAPAALAPIEPQERIQTIDILRGFALFGILWMNMPAYQQGPGFQQIVDQLGNLFAEGKFVALYSFLFGLGFSVLLLRAQARGAPIVLVYLRRLFVLLLIGIAHFVFLRGDVLQSYAVMGGVLLLVRGRSLRTLLALAALSLVFNVFFDTAVSGVRSWRRADPEVARARQLQAAADGFNRWAVEQRRFRAEDRGTYAELVSIRASLLPERYSRREKCFNGFTICMFLLGFYAGRRGIFHDTAAHVPFLRKLMWWALGIGFTLNLAETFFWEFLFWEFHLSLPRWVGRALWTLGRPPLCLFYLSAITLLLQREWWRERLRPLSWAGRMGLTNYLLQSVICTTIFYGYGFGLMPKATPTLAFGLAVFIYAFQIALSMWWIRRFRFGPVEWLWRSLTYMQLQPMRVARS